MTYVISDLHGYPIEKLKMLLEKAEFGEEDFLYILGDVVGRNGNGGVGILLWLLEQLNVQLLLGNHEVMLLACDFVFDEITEDSIETMEKDETGKYLLSLLKYFDNGGQVTLEALRKLPREKQQDILDYLRDCPLYKEVTADGKDYILVHSCIENFSEDRKLSDYSVAELTEGSTELWYDYFDDIHMVFGHTPTHYYGEKYDGKIIKTPTWTDIDVGVELGNEPILLRLDDYKEFKL